MRRILWNVRYYWSEFCHTVAEVVRFTGMLASFAIRTRGVPGILLAFVVFGCVYWTSPDWARQIGFVTHADHIEAVAAKEQKLINIGVARAAGTPIAVEKLPEWRPTRVEARFESGFMVVSTLNAGPHGNFQYVVRDLDLPPGTVFRVMRGSATEI